MKCRVPFWNITSLVGKNRDCLGELGDWNVMMLMKMWIKRKTY